MLTLKQRFQYLFDAYSRRNQPVACPCCGTAEVKLVDRKYLFTRLFECQTCYLNFRHPLEIVEQSDAFYQDDYVQDDGLTTHLPSPAEIEAMRRTQFAAFPDRSIHRLLPMFAHCFPEGRTLKVLDYGASWGYMTYQFQELGHDAEGFEISVPRARFGRDALNVTIHTTADSLSNEYDLFFSSHVIEHVPNPSELVEFARNRVRENGYCMILCPNGSEAFRNKQPQKFHRLWGRVHPHLPTGAFFQKSFKDTPYFIATTPEGRGRILEWNRTSQFNGDNFEGPELVAIARPRFDS